eukprot:5488248-Amphidinium_carterae.1
MELFLPMLGHCWRNSQVQTLGRRAAEARLRHVCNDNVLRDFKLVGCTADRLSSFGTPSETPLWAEAWEPEALS